VLEELVEPYETFRTDAGSTFAVPTWSVIAPF